MIKSDMYIGAYLQCWECAHVEHAPGILEAVMCPNEPKHIINWINVPGGFVDAYCDEHIHGIRDEYSGSIDEFRLSKKELDIFKILIQ